jgi:hypothetical protein
MREQYQMKRKNYAGITLSMTGGDAASRMQCVPADAIYPPEEVGGATR